MMRLDVETGDVCSIKKDFCQNCHNHYKQLRPSIKGVSVSKNFLKELGEEKGRDIVEKIMNCSHMEFTELHKYEKRVDGFLVFRAKIEGAHIVYCIDKERKVIMFLRHFDNYSKYKRFLEDDRELKRAVSRAA